MSKRLPFVVALLVVLVLTLASCTTPEAEIVEVTRMITETIEVEGEPVEVTRVVEEQVEVTRVVEAAVEVTRVVEGEAVGEAYPRAETLYTSGTQYGPPNNWNPMVTWGYATGTLGLCYETLYLYDPLTDEYIPWLAENGEWISDNVYQVTIRDGITWQDGEPFTAEDVVFTMQLGQDAPIFYAPMWNFLESAEATNETTIEFTFSDALYHEWANYLYTIGIVPQHLWQDKTAEEIATGANENPVCTGPYIYATHSQDRMVWEKNPNWWATEALDLDVTPQRIVDIVNPSNNVALGLVLQDQVDLSNNFLPGIATLVEGGYGIQTYFPEPPYMIGANTAWLVMNHTIEPMGDPAFRRAMAYAINVDEIVEVVYGNIVEKANPTGLLPIWDEWVDQDVVDELGFTYDAEQARAILAEAGYVDTDGDGFVETPDGDPIELSVIVPFGWTDWMESARVIASSAQAAGINVTPDFPDYNGYVDQRNGGTFEMAVSNEAQASNTVWTYYDWVFQEPIQDTMTSGNYQRYDNQEVFDLVVQLDQTPLEETEQMQEIISQIQRIQLEDMPIIPMWYNGLWAQYNDNFWTNWPTTAEDTPHYMPATWRGYWNMASILMLTELEPAPTE